MQRIDRIGEPGEFAFGPHECPDVGVGELHETESVEDCGDAVGADLDPVHADSRASKGGAPHQKECQQGGQRHSRAAQFQEVEHIVEQPRDDRDDPCPDEPHVEGHQSRRVIAAHGSDKRRDQRQRIGCQGPADQNPTCGGSAAALTAEMDPVGRKSSQGKYQSQCQKHLSIQFVCMYYNYNGVARKIVLLPSLSAKGYPSAGIQRPFRREAGS